jgi:hypothetical protein
MEIKINDIVFDKNVLQKLKLEEINILDLTEVKYITSDVTIFIENNSIMVKTAPESLIKRILKELKII